MSRHHVHDTSWGLIDFDDQTGAVFVQQKWLYHEFGHAILSGSATSNPDEYVNTSGNVADTSSIMNIGRDLRKRHLTAVIAELNKLIPGLTFTVVIPAL